MASSKEPIWSSGPFKLYDRALEIIGKPNKQIVTATANRLSRHRGASMWALGDLSVYAETVLGWDSFEEALKQTNANYHTLRHAYYVAKAFAPDVRTFDLSFEHYRSVYTFPEDVRNRLLKLAEDNEWSIDEFKTQLRKLRRDVKTETLSFPEGRYGLIYADPPWEYDQGSTDPTRDIENQYPTMSLDEIKALADSDGKTVKDLAAKDCLLYLWATSPKLAEALEVVAAWGFEYRTNMVWEKDIAGMGYWARQRHELLLICARGNPMTPPEDKRPDSIIVAPRTSKHSEKPGIVRDMLDDLYPPKIPRIELFAREAHVGWHIWGLDAPKDDASPLLPEHDDPPVKTQAEIDAENANAKSKSKPRLVKSKKSTETREQATA